MYKMNIDCSQHFEITDIQELSKIKALFIVQYSIFYLILRKFGKLFEPNRKP